MNPLPGSDPIYYTFCFHFQRYMQLNDRAPALHILHNLGSQSTLVRETHFRSESAVGYPFAGVAGCGLLQHAVDLFEGETLGFRDEEIGVQEAADAEGAPDEEDFGAEVTFVGIDHVGGDDCNDLVLVSMAITVEQVDVTYAVP